MFIDFKRKKIKVLENVVKNKRVLYILKLPSMIFAQNFFNAGYLQFQLVFKGRYDRSKIQEEFFEQEIKSIELDTAENFRFP